MKIKHCCAAFVAALTLVGCNEKIVGSSLENESSAVDDEMVDLTVDVADPVTKLTGEYVDKKVNKIQLFVFDKLGVLETTATAESSSVSVKCRNGEKHLVALVNAETLNGVKTLDELAHKKADLKTMSAGNEVMVGSRLDTLRTNRKQISLDVKRLAARIVLSQVEVRFEGTEYFHKEVKLKALYLVNAAGERCYLADDAPTFWYNEGGYQASTCPKVIYDDLKDEVMTSGVSTRYQSNYFYCYPNGLDKQTRMVLETEIDGEIFYYPINLGTIKSGHCYRCALLIRHLGSYSPDVAVEEMSMNSTVSVEPWVWEDVSIIEI